MTTILTAQQKDKMMSVPLSGTTEEKKIHKNVINQNESEELNKLFEALAKSQLEMEVARTDSINPYFKSRYADLASIVKASRPFLAKNGLCVIQRTVTDDDGQTILFTRLCHSSGQWIESNMAVKPPKADIQTMGSYLTYLRRYMYAALTGVVASDEDDDGEVSMEVPRKSNGNELISSKISQAQLQVIAGELSSHPEILESLLKGFEINKIADLPAKKYSGCIGRIREIIRAKED